MAIRKEEERESGLFVKWLYELNKDSGSVAGGKGANLAEMYNNKFPVPPAFIITAQAYDFFIKKTGIEEEIRKIIESTDIDDTKELDEASKKIKELIVSKDMPKELQDDILENYEFLGEDAQLKNLSAQAALILKNTKDDVFVAVRSSATTEDLASASFAGQQESFLNVKGKNQLIEYVKKCMASLFTARAIYYRQKKGFKHGEALLAVVVQRMINSDRSGVMFSSNPIANDNNIVIEAVYGLGEGIVSGRILPDNYIVNKDLEIVSKKIADKKVAIVRNSQGDNVIVKLTEDRSKSKVLEDHEIKNFANYAMRLEQHYGKPQDIEFAVEDKQLYIVQTRPITTKVQGEQKEFHGEVLLKGLGASPGISFGVVKIIREMVDLEKVKKGDVLVTTMTNPDMVVSMQKASAIVTDEGGVTSHAAIVSREMGIPAVVGTEKATSLLKDGMIITVDGGRGMVYAGKGEEKKVEIKPVVKTKTEIKVIVDLPDYAERAAKTKARAVGLTRIEGIIAESGKHPLYFVKKNNMKDYEDVIYNGIRKIASPFEEVWVRTSDIRSDEFLHLEGAPKHVEINPMLGMHGIRFSLKYPEIMKAEMLACKRVAEEGKIIGLMFPQVISVEEVVQAKKLAEELGLNENIKIGVMVETPAAVQIIEDLCKEGIHFISFGTNDLTQYTLAIDRGNDETAPLYSETHPAVLRQIKYVIGICKKYNVISSICGQAASRRDMAQELVLYGIDSLSVNADAAYDISLLVSELEGKGIVGAGIEKAEEIGEKIGQEIISDYKKVEGFVKKEVTVIEKKMGMGDRKKEMHKTDCSLCGKEIEVPFIPDGVRPVYCKECLIKPKEEKERGLKKEGAEDVGEEVEVGGNIDKQLTQEDEEEKQAEVLDIF